ncbi:MAG: ferritin-like domain-containing protein [Prosthecobacter sp.]|uniref:ferritin-like domain-containing protein n=1 Tax=Prosthecobacter sp. TaxID=1965333 RepID=UPI0038FEEC73
MLRIDHKLGVIPRDYHDDYLELVQLLTEAAGIEHSLMKTYLYGLFSIKPKYHKLRGHLKNTSFMQHSPGGRHGSSVLHAHETVLAVALEEMQHLGMVNRFLAALGAAPNFVPHHFPYTSDVYPFDLELRPMDRYAAAMYLWIEADTCALSLSKKCAGKSEPKRFIEEVFRELKRGSPRFRARFAGEKAGAQVPNHVGSVYHAIIETTQRLAASPPDFIPANFPWNDWIQKLNWIVEQGEIAHYQLFRGVFTGEAFGSDARIWKHTPGSPDYPVHLFTPQSAYTHRPNTIRNEKARRLAWLSNLHYWLILTLLDGSYRGTDLRLLYKGIDNMTLSLWQLGDWLALKYKTGLPFDQFGPQYMFGRTAQTSIPIIERLVLEARNCALALQKEKLLPPDYDLKIFDLTLAGLRPADTDPDAPRTPSA